ncbi:MAG: zinc ribbon domain-containing protein [Sandaracinaceae bacterium]|nr:zinc ribbon domain-containing protein [Sandaracinaceae bacterium]
MQLTPCPACARHVRAGERTCPFCGHTAHAPFFVAPRPRLPGRIGRAAMLTFRAAVIGAAGAASACGSSTGLLDPAPLVDAAAAPVPGEDAGPAPSLLDAGRPPPDAGRMREEDSGTSVALYGGPGVEPVDAAGPADAGFQALYGGPSPVPEPSDAGPEDAGGAVNLYGGPSA